MYKLWLLLALVCMQTVAAQKRATPENSRLTGLDSAFAHVLSVWKGPGFAIAIVEKNKLVYVRGFGYRNTEQKLPVTPNTLFAIGSCTKAFTASLIGTLAAKEKLDIDKPVRDYFPELTFYNADMNDKITLRDMMSHRTGLPRHDYSWYYFTTSSRDSLVKRIRFLEPSAADRDKWQYNNFMFMAQGALAEKITHEPWEKNIRSAFFEPLGMTRSNFSVADLAKDNDAARGYEIKDTGIAENLQKMDYYAIDAMGPAGSINSSAMDMSNWLITWIHGGKFKGKEIIPAGFAKDAMSSQMIMGSGFPDVETKDVYFSNYGLAWMLASYRGHYRVEHGGNIDGFSTSSCFFPTDSIGIVVLCNQNNSIIPSIVRNLAADKMLGLKYKDWNTLMKNIRDKGRQAEKAAKAAMVPTPKKEIKAYHALKDYEGLFNNPGYGTLEVLAAEDSLFMHIGKKSWWLKHDQYDWFEILEKDKDGKTDTADHGLHAEFRTSAVGEVNEFDIPFEPTLKPLPFNRVPKAAVVSADSLKKFEGQYQISNLAIQVTLRNKTLYMLVPGQPEYELIPLEKNKFSLKSLTGYSVQFNRNDQNLVTEMLSVQPNGTFKATRKK